MPVNIENHLSSKEELAWYRILKDYEQSGLSQQAYSELKQVDRKGLMKWRRKLAKKEGEIIKENYAKRLKIAPVRLKKERANDTEPVIRLELSNNVKLYIPTGFDSYTLKKILEVIS